jgi:ABC-type amino acid transport substrate-binding protein
MAKKWPLGQLFQRDGNDLEDEYKVLSAMGAEEKELPKKAAEPAPMQETGDTVYFAEIKGALLGVWEKWTGDPNPPTLKMTGKLGAAEAGSAGEAYAKGFEGADIKGFPYQTDCLMEVNSGSRDFAVVDAQLAKSYCGKGDYADLEIIDALSSDVEYYAIGFKKGSDLTAQVNAQLEALAADGTIAALAEKYGVANTAITDFSDQK